MAPQARDRLNGTRSQELVAELETEAAAARAWMEPGKLGSEPRGGARRIAKPEPAPTGSMSPNSDRAIFQPEKITDYALNLDHISGGTKAWVFASELRFT